LTVKKCEKCHKKFITGYAFGQKTQHTIDNQLCPICYDEWLIAVHDPTTETEHKSGSNEYWEAFLIGFKEKVLLN
jgi:hypothetical protein